GAWLRCGQQRVTLSAVAVSTSTVSTVIFNDATVLRVRDPVHYADVSLSGHVAWRRFELDGIALSRHVSKGELQSTPAASVAAAWWGRADGGGAGAGG